MDKEYIDREAVVKLREEFWKDRCDYMAVRVTNIMNIPTADVEVVRHGEWKVVYSNNMGIVYECSECGHLTFGTSDYCICGAKMDGKGE